MVIRFLITHWAARLDKMKRVLLTLFGVRILFAVTAVAQSPVMLTISTQSPDYRIPNDFAGLSFETGSELLNRNHVSGYFFSTTNTAVITLFKTSVTIISGSVAALLLTAPTPPS